ncbi:glycosyltransferase [Aureitalea sp. L0-47]|uniref:glycosyltransferase n=1 Tax=Aureitalea sp. L0-47 TaxID=2816962 RepID=UPI0022382ACD|nr:glycosyltransferase [Aureitalea sp. L0-47]MCW5520694.1 glycosyltransferase [Aureitalea sp. L0-47]
MATSLGKGGAERSCAMLSNMLDSLGYEVHTVILQDRVDQAFSGTLLNLGKGKKENDSFGDRLYRAYKLKRFLRSNNFDFIIDHRPKNESKREMFYDRYVYKGIRRIYVVHSSNKFSYFSEKEERMIDIYSKNYATVAVSRYIETELLNSSGIHNTVTIYNAFDTNWVSVGDELPIQLRDKQYLLWYGRVVDEIKDLRFLIDAFEQSEVWKQGTHLVIMGDGPDSEDIKKYAKQSAAGAHVDFLPHTPNPFPVIKYARSTVLTSRYEGFPMVLVESLSVGTPVISLDIASGPSEIVVDGENGLLIPERSLPLFSEAIRKIKDDDSLYERLSSNAKSSIEAFSMEAIAARWKKLLE